MLYTRKGDNGTTKTFGCDQRVSKSSKIAEALGTLDEINSLLGICKFTARASGFQTAPGLKLDKIVGDAQQNLFIVQAELAGADKKITTDKVMEIEQIVDGIEKELPPITTFFVSGGSELSSFFDLARTVARRAERRVVEVKEEGQLILGSDTLAYLNRLSSLLYALARLSNAKSGITEESPTYK